MFCTNCGSKIEDGSRFCPECGAKLETVETAAPFTEEPAAEENVAEENIFVKEEPAYEAPSNGIWDAPVPVAPDVVYEEPEAVPEVTGSVAGTVNTTPVFVLGIIGALLSCMWFAALAGLIISAINLGKARSAIRANGGHNWKTRVGKYLSVFGLIMGIVMTIVGFIIFIAMIAGGAAGAVEDVLGELM